MRLKINFCLSDKLNNDIFESIFKKIIFPVNTFEITTILELKKKLSDYLNYYKKNENISLLVENIFLDNFILIDDFCINDIINNDDELK